MSTVTTTTCDRCGDVELPRKPSTGQSIRLVGWWVPLGNCNAETVRRDLCKPCRDDLSYVIIGFMNSAGRPHEVGAARSKKPARPLFN